MKKRIISSLITAVLLMGLVGCGGNSDSANSTGNNDAAQDSGEEVTLNFLTWRGDDSAAYDQVVANFNEENPNIKVNFEYVVDAYEQVLTTRLLSNDVDLFALDGHLDMYVDGGNLLELTGQSFLDNYQEGALESCTFDGKVYGACQMFCMVNTFYNVDMLEEMGYTGEPKTWDEFIEICDKFMEKGIHPIACGNAANLSTQLGYQLLVSMIPDHSSDLFNEIVAGEAKMTDEPMATVSKLVKQVSDADYYCEGSTGLDKFGACEVFMRGEAPFLVEGSWRAITLAEDETLNWDVFSISAPGGAEDVYLFRPAQIHVINANTPHKDEALKYYEFMSRPESMEIFSSTTVQVPVGNDVTVDHPALNKVVDYMNSHKAGGDPQVKLENAEIGSLMNEYFGSITLGTPIEDAVATIEQGFENMKAQQ